MMEEMWRIKNKLISTGKHHPHQIILVSLLLISIAANGVMISYMGISAFVDSFTHSEDYLILSQDQFNNNSLKNSIYAVIIQKKSINSTSLDEQQDWCYETTTGFYLINSQTTHQTDPRYSETSIGSVTSYIPSNPFIVFSFEWWQQTIRLLDNVKSLQ